MTTLERVRARALGIWEEAGLMDQAVEILAEPLSVEHAIGNADGRDFPIRKGKEKLMEARFRNARGQAFTDTWDNYRGKLADIARLDLGHQLHRAVFVGTLNAVMRSLDKADRTVHCRDEGPRTCSEVAADHIRAAHGAPRIGLVGYQPALIAGLSGEFDLRALDLDPNNIGQVRHGTRIEGGEATPDVLRWADLLLVTGTTLANGSIDLFLGQRPVVFYGTTIAGAAAIMGWERYCPCAS